MMTMLILGLDGVGVLSIAGVATLLLGKSSASLRHVVWTAALAALVAIPVLEASGFRVEVAVPARWLEASVELEASMDMRAEGESVTVGVVDHAPPRSDVADGAAEKGAAESGNIRLGDAGLSVLASQTVAIRERQASQLVTASEVADRGLEAGMNAETSERPMRSGAGSVGRLVAGVWAVGSLLFLVMTLFSHLGARRLTVHNVTRCATSAFQRFTALSVELGIKRPVRLVVSSTIRVPATWGFWRSTVVLPAEYGSWSPETLDRVLVHELAHIGRGDCWSYLLAELARAVHWPNPLVWLALYRQRLESERACDDQVLGRGNAASAYADDLLAMVRALRASKLPRAALAMADRSGASGRVRAILNPKQSRGRAGRLTVLAVGAVAIGLAAAATVVTPVAVAQEVPVLPAPLPPITAAIPVLDGDTVASVPVTVLSQQIEVAAADSVLSAPLRAYQIGGRFAPRPEGLLGRHSGIDLIAPEGTPVLAAAGGTVSFAGYRGGFGNVVVVDHGDGYSTLYAHLSTLEATEGRSVERGEAVGRVGVSGTTTFPHLHFEVHENGVERDPEEFMEELVASTPTGGVPQTALTGDWILTIRAHLGDPSSSGSWLYVDGLLCRWPGTRTTEYHITVTQDGQALTATGVAGGSGGFELSGSVDGAGIRLLWERNFPPGCDPLDFRFTGTVTADSMSGSVEVGDMGRGEWTATRVEDLADVFGLELDRLQNQYETVAQRQLTEDTEEAVRRLERLARETSDQELNQQLADAARRLQDVAADMRRSASASLDRLEGAQRRLEQASSEQLEEVRRLIEEQQRRLERQQRLIEEELRRLERELRMVLLSGDVEAVRDRAEALAGEQRDIAEDMDRLAKQRGGPTSEAGRRLLERKVAMAEEVDALWREIQRLRDETRSDQRDVSDLLERASQTIEDDKLWERVRYSQGLIGVQDTTYTREFEVETTRIAEKLHEELRRAADAIGSQGQQGQQGQGQQGQQGQQQGQQGQQGDQQGQQGDQQGQQGQQGQSQQGQQAGQQSTGQPPIR